MGGRLLGNFLAIPAKIFQLPTNIAKDITLPKAWLQHNGFIQARKDQLIVGKNRLRDKAQQNDCVKGMMNCLGYSNAIDAEAKEQAAFAEHARRVQNEYNSLAPRTVWHSTKGLLFRTNDSARQSRFNEEIRANYLKDVMRNNLGQPLSDPIMSSQLRTAPHDNNWGDHARHQEQLQKMLSGDFPEGKPFAESMMEYQAIKLALRNTGKYEPSAPPAPQQEAPKPNL